VAAASEGCVFRRRWLRTGPDVADRVNLSLNSDAVHVEQEVGAMSAFEIVHHDDVVGKLTCFDRLIFKGHLGGFNVPGRLLGFLFQVQVLLKHFDSYVTDVTAMVKGHVQVLAAEAGRPYVYLAETHTKSRGQSKEELARQIATRDGVTAGLVCVLAAVEPCSSFSVFKNKQTHRLELVRRRRKCLHFYCYWIHPELGFCHVRLQSWFPFEIQVWVNGREALSRELERRRIHHVRWANAIVKLVDWPFAQRLADRLATRRWRRLLNGLARQINPMLEVVEATGMGGYYWVVDQAEIATDIAFRSRHALEAVVPGLVAHATSAFGAGEVLRFLGRKLVPTLGVEITSDVRRRPEGWRVKHRMATNSIKFYDKANVLRVETTINDPTQFRVQRVKDGRRTWCQMRKSVTDLARFYQLGRQANERYLDALAAATDNRAGIAVLERHTQPIHNRGRQHPRLDLLGRDQLAVFRAVLAGEHNLVGFRNHDLQRQLHPRPAADTAQTRRHCQHTSRLIAKLRAHGLITKIPRRRSYRVTGYGHRVMTTAIAIHDQQFPHIWNTTNTV
jgi:hypothetical protein